MNIEETKEFKKRLLVSDHGTPEEQKNTLVEVILNSFQEPSQWPLTDPERIELLRRLYRMAITIRETEKP